MGSASTSELTVILNGREVVVEEGTTLAAALLNADVLVFRRSRSGAPRAPLCGMGVCFDCMVTVDSEKNVRACLVRVKEGMRVETDL